SGYRRDERPKAITFRDDHLRDLFAPSRGRFEADVNSVRTPIKRTKRQAEREIEKSGENGFGN
ncbi:Hypothetical predicted protein, partial [Olea europaea subsp. europaea]